MGEWKEIKLDNIAELVKDKYTPQKGDELHYIGLEHIQEQSLRLKGLGNSDEITSDKFHFNSGDILFGKLRPYFRKVIIPKLDGVCSTDIWVVRSKYDINQIYLFYLFASKKFVDLSDSSASGTRMPRADWEFMRNTIWVIPINKTEQKAIASVLSSLNDKIDLLHRQNKTLEAMAETLFRQWFVEEAQEMNYGKIGDFVSVIDNRGKTPPYIENPTIYPIIEVNALIGENRLVDYSVIKKYVVQETYDSWFRGHPKKYDTIISTVGSIGETAMFLIEKGTIAQNVIVLSPTNISPFYLYQFVKSSKNEIKELDIGSVQPSIKVPHLLSVDIPIPNSKQLIEFDNQIKLFLNKMSLNYSQIRTLEKLRDTLLSKLMSGKVSVEYEQERDC